MIEINAIERYILNDLCSTREDDTMLLWFLDGGKDCSAWVDQKEQPEEAMILIADFCYLLGKVMHPAELRNLLLEHGRYKIIIGSPEWIQFLNTEMKDQLYSFKRYAIQRERENFDTNHLKKLIHHLSPEYVIERIKEEAFWEVLNIPWTADGCCFFKSYEDFAENGLGFIIKWEGQIVCIASSYVAVEDRIPITIGTLEEHRRKGLAAACAARLIMECLERNLYPEWEAANPESVALAEKLGYHFDKEYDVYSLI